MSFLIENLSHVLEFDCNDANSKANGLIEKGWKLLHVGTKLVDIENQQACYNTCYVLGGTKKQHNDYEENLSNIKKTFKKPD